MDDDKTCKNEEQKYLDKFLGNQNSECHHVQTSKKYTNRLHKAYVGDMVDFHSTTDFGFS